MCEFGVVLIGDSFVRVGFFVDRLWVEWRGEVKGNGKRRGDMGCDEDGQSAQQHCGDQVLGQAR